MFQTWRLQLREASEAFKIGDLTGASRLLRERGLAQFLPGKQLATQIAHRRAERGLSLARRGDLAAAWREFDESAAMGVETHELTANRLRLVEAAIAEVERRLRGGEVAGALAILEDLERRKVTNPALPALKQIAQRLQSAEHLAQRGKFADAETQLVAAAAMRPQWMELEQARADYHAKAERIGALTEQLHRNMVQQCWSEAVALADQLLALAPDSPLGRDARRRAWAKAGAKYEESQPSNSRLLLWVDGVGGYLVCLANEITLGQSAPGNRVDVAILADISRRHAKIRREGEGYVLEPLHTTCVNDRPVRNPVLLHDGDEIELGSGVRLRFRQPHALSATARLEFTSRHRTQPFADGVLLMAESCVLGPRWQNHIVCPDWNNDVVLFRQDDELYCRAMQAIEIDGEFHDGRGRLGCNSHVAGGDFSLSLEELDKCVTQPLL